MKMVPILAARINLDDLARRVERGETIVLTQDGKPRLELKPHKKIWKAKKKRKQFPPPFTGEVPSAARRRG
jgi:antitoxin (DNA-binding transcriptional repressor) of toxin-antitoxin stability system